MSIFIVAPFAYAVPCAADRGNLATVSSPTFRVRVSNASAPSGIEQRLCTQVALMTRRSF
jgi:hypothetical protein